MTRITIEIEEAGAAKVEAKTTGAGGVQAIGGTESTPEASGVPADLASRASAIGAQNGGPAPSLAGLQSQMAPVAFISSEAALAPGATATSAGAAPEQLFGDRKSS